MEFLIADLLKIILNFLPLLDLVKFRRTNKTWQKLIDSVYDNTELTITCDSEWDLIFKQKGIYYLFDTHFYFDIKESKYHDISYLVRKYGKIINELDRLIHEFNLNKSSLEDYFSCNLPFTTENTYFSFESQELRFDRSDEDSFFVIDIRGNEFKIIKVFLDLIGKLKIFSEYS